MQRPSQSFQRSRGPLSAAAAADGSAEVDAAGATMAQESAVADGISASAAQIPQIEGLDLGHWPSNYIIRMIQYLHEGVGLEWWAAIALTTVVLRSAMVPLAISSAGNAGRLSKMKPELDAVLARMKSDPLVEAGDTDRKMMYANEVKALQKLHNASPGRSFLPILVQMPVFMSFFFGLRRMAEEGFPSMASGGPDWSWFQDLTVADTTYAFPVRRRIIFAHS